MRCVIAADRQGALIPFARAVFVSYWGDLNDISRPEILAVVATSVGLDAQSLLTRAQSDDVKHTLRQNTDELIARGGFGSPTMFVDGDDIYFGNDRLPLVEAALARSS